MSKNTMQDHADRISGTLTQRYQDAAYNFAQAKEELDQSKEEMIDECKAPLRALHSHTLRIIKKHFNPVKGKTVINIHITKPSVAWSCRTTKRTFYMFVKISPARDVWIKAEFAVKDMKELDEKLSALAVAADSIEKSYRLIGLDKEEAA